MLAAGQQPNETDAPEVWYLLDPDDRIIGVGGAGWAFAGGSVTGTSVYDHVAGHFSRKFLKEFLGRARRQSGLTRQCYRCDTPDAKRLMEMRVDQQSPDVLRVTHRTLGACALPFAVHFREVPRPRARHLRCSSCNRLRGKRHDVWLEPEDAVGSGETVLVVHTVCPDCRHQIGMRRQSLIFNIRDIE